MNKLQIFNFENHTHLRIGGDIVDGRKCPKCWHEQYSDYTGPWKCQKCGYLLTTKDSIKKAPAGQQEQTKTPN